MRLKHRHLHQSDRCRCWLGVLERRVAALIPAKAEPIKRRLPLTPGRGAPAGLGRPAPKPPRRKLRVGIVWSGNPKHPNDHNRSVPLRMLLDVRDPHGDFVSLQKGPGPDDMILLRQAGILDLTSASPILPRQRSWSVASTSAKAERCSLVLASPLVQSIRFPVAAPGRHDVGDNDNRAHDALQRREFGTNRKHQVKTGICVENYDHARVFFVQHPSTNAL
jgi:hypothetical protein